jgi:serine/threonine protein kinase
MDTFETETHSCIVMEVFPTGSLHQMLKARKVLTELEVRFFG